VGAKSMACLRQNYVYWMNYISALRCAREIWFLVLQILDKRTILSNTLTKSGLKILYKKFQGAPKKYAAFLMINAYKNLKITNLKKQAEGILLVGICY
jgi:hypothetical protein